MLFGRGRCDEDHFRPQGNSVRKKTVSRKAIKMRKEYDFSKAKKNPYAKRLKLQVTIRLDKGTIEYFKGIAQDAGMPYQTLINLYLSDCAKAKRKPSIQWKTAAVS
jgi:predicted DNA binding CopG/RHH family protein